MDERDLLEWIQCFFRKSCRESMLCFSRGTVEGLWVKLTVLMVNVQISDAVQALKSEFEAVDGLVASNLNRVIHAYANARVGSHVSFPLLTLFI